jgi:hypothetical protein
MGALTLTFRCDLHAPRAARMALRELGREVDGRVLQDLCLVVSELVTNRVHAGSQGPLRVTVEVDSATEVRGEVDDQDVDEEAVPAGVLPGESALPLVDALTSRWGFYPGSHHVWFEIAA